MHTASPIPSRRRGRPPKSRDALSDTRALLGEKVKIKESLHGVSSNYFEARGRLRLDDVTVYERSLVRRFGRSVSTVWRQRGAVVLANAANTTAP